MIRRAFALAEMIMAMAIVGVAVVSILILTSSQTVSAGATSQICEAVHLANNVHEFAMSLPLIAGTGSTFTTTATDPKLFTNSYNLDGWNSGTSGPINCNGDRITALSGWKQSCQMKAFDITNPGVPVSPSNMNPRKLMVTVSYQGKSVYTCSWVLAPTVQ